MDSKQYKTRQISNALILGLVAIIGIISLYNLYGLRNIPANVSTATTSPVLDRVIQTGELRVGYLVLPPYMSKETSSGKLSGIFYDVTVEMSARLGLKLSWVEEVNLATLSEGLAARKYDMIAFPLWRSSSRAKNVAFSTPLFYSTLGIYVRSDDSRFDGKISALNDADVTVATMDGELAADIAKTDFPNAQLTAVPQLSDYSLLLLEVVSRKADVTFFNRVMAKRFMNSNPGKIKDISAERPIRVFAECFILPLDDPAFRSMIDSTLLEMIENGQIDQAFAANGENPEEYFRPAKPYRDPVR